MTAPSSDPILYECADGVALLTLNRPEKRNAFNGAMTTRWVECLEHAQAEDDVRVIVITGAGVAFCSGGDIDEMGNDPSPLAIQARLRDGVQRIPQCLSRMDKPVIAAINGAATGAGLDLALMCDLRFAAATARMAETYVRMGIVPGAGGAYFLPRLVGTAKALELFWSAEFVSAEEARELGLVNRVYPDELLLSETREFALRLAHAAPLSVRLIKRAVMQSANTDLATSLDLISSHMTLVRSSEDHAEAVRAFREKRSPRFTGR